MVYRIYTEKKTGFNNEAKALMNDFKTLLKIGGIEKVRLIKYAESLGGVETLITYPTTQTHADVPEELRLKNGITPSTLRLSVGIENVDDLIADLAQALK